MRARTSTLFVAAAVAGGAISAVAVGRARRAWDTGQALDGIEIAPGVFCIGPRGRTQTNVYLVRAGSSWVLVDAGWAADAPRIAAAVGRLLPAGEAPAAILLTHVHPDHSGAAGALAEAWECPILLHPADAPFADGDLDAMQPFLGPLDRWAIMPAMRAMGEHRRAAALARGSLAGAWSALASDGSVPGADGWAWIHTPGHTPGHVSYLRAADRVILTGDALLTLQVNAPSGIVLGRQGLSGPPWYTTWDPRSSAASIDALAALEPTVVGGGHGRPLSGPGTAEAVRRFAARS